MYSRTLLRNKGDGEMNNKYLLLLAFDALLLELDDEYEGVPEEHLNLIQSKVYECYGLKVTSSKEDIKNINALLIHDVKNYREQIIKEITTE